MASLCLGAPALCQTQALSLSLGISGTPCKLLSGMRRNGRNDSRNGPAALRGLQYCHQQGRIGRIIAQQAEEEIAGRGDEGGDDDFDARLAKLQRKVTSGTGKKAEARKARKEVGDFAPSSAPKENLFIAPVPLKEPVSGGLHVQLGINSYTERLHGRLAALGLVAVLLVELATGDSFIKYHDTGTLTLQVYTSFALATVFVKFEKERISVWPKL